ncbi:MAG: hypothetical protein Q9181_005972 [Wetmoreana brouardii]
MSSCLAQRQLLFSMTPFFGKINGANMKEGHDDYVLARGPQAAARLNLQHYLFREQLGFLLHPVIPFAREDLKIADVGTGTGELDIFSSIPEDLVGRYDIVHARLFFLVVRNGDPIPLLQNLIKLLKPGGYIQWVEIDADSRRAAHLTPVSYTKDMVALFDSMNRYSPNIGPHGWVSKLNDIFIRNGLSVEHFERSVQPPELYKPFTDNTLLAYDEFSRTVLDPRGKGEGEALRGSIAAAYQCSQQGVAILLDKIVVVGRKPE